MPTEAQFQNGIYISGSYAGAAAHAPVLRLQNGTALNLNNPPGMGTHYSLSFGVLPPPPVGGLPLGAPAPVRPFASSATTPTSFEGAYVPEPNTGGQTIPFRAAGAPRVVYLPFVQSMVCSAILPGNAAAGVDRFYTDNLSGCSVFIDRVTGTNDIVVYHGNRVDMTVMPNPAQYVATTAFPLQYLPARTAMRNDHTAAQADLLAQMAPGSALAAIARCERATYFLPVENELLRKRGQGRTHVDIGAAGTNVVGFRAGTSWRFYWQTWALLTYDRPMLHVKTLIGRRHQDARLGHARLLGCGLICIT